MCQTGTYGVCTRNEVVFVLSLSPRYYNEETVWHRLVQTERTYRENYQREERRELQTRKTVRLLNGNIRHESVDLGLANTNALAIEGAQYMIHFKYT